MQSERHVRMFRNGSNQALRIPREFELEAQQREIVTRALEETRWNRTAAAKKLGLE